MEALQKIERQELETVEPVDSGNVIAASMAGLERMAKDPALDVSKLEKVFDFQMRMLEKWQEQQFHSDMVLCSASMPVIVKRNKNSQTNSLYAKLEDIAAEAKPIYHRHGFTLKTSQQDCPIPGKIRYSCKVSHKLGWSEEHHLDLSPDDTGQKGNQSKTKIHGELSTLTYAERYLMCSIFDITVDGLDRDGNKPKKEPLRDPMAPVGQAEPEKTMAPTDSKAELEAAKAPFRKNLGLVAGMVGWDKKNLGEAEAWLRSVAIIGNTQSLASLTASEIEEANRKVEVLLQEMGGEK